MTSIVPDRAANCNAVIPRRPFVLGSNCSFSTKKCRKTRSSCRAARCSNCQPSGGIHPSLNGKKNEIAYCNKSACRDESSSCAWSSCRSACRGESSSGGTAALVFNKSCRISRKASACSCDSSSCSVMIERSSCTTRRRGVLSPNSTYPATNRTKCTSLHLAAEKVMVGKFSYNRFSD
jgi:hypothetical protein